MPRDTLTAFRRRTKAMEDTVNNAVREVEAERKASFDAARDASREAEATRHHFTRDEVAAATHVRIHGGWHKVIRVNVKSVTVDTPYSWTDRYPFDTVLEVRTLGGAS